jgi:hypothetical protein
MKNRSDSGRVSIVRPTGPLLLFRPIGTIPTAAAAAIPAPQVVGRGENHITRDGVDRIIDTLHEFACWSIRQFKIRL